MNLGSTQNIRVTLAGEGARVEIIALALVADAAAQIDIEVVHSAPRTASSQLLRCVAGERGTIALKMNAIVPPATPSCVIRQDNKNLLLAETADIRAEPFLAIETDEVTASHGSATGALSAEAVWYLASRGVDAATARGLLTTAFVAPVLEKLPEELRKIAEQRLLLLTQNLA